MVFADLSGSDGGPRSMASNSRFKLGKDPSGPSAPFLTREARSNWPQAEMSAMV
jgi:hypothetical protein